VAAAEAEEDKKEEEDEEEAVEWEGTTVVEVAADSGGLASEVPALATPAAPAPWVDTCADIALA
jgi:hypothetical protein